MNGRQPAVGSRQPAVDSQQSAVGGRQSAAKNGPRRVLFVTGRLAEPALRRVLAATPLPFAYDVAVLRITVAALMTTAWIARSLSTPDVPDGTDLVMIPGLCEGDPQLIADKLGLRVEKGPGDLRELPGHFGRPAATDNYGAWDIEIVAEINNAPKLTREDIRKAAEYFHASGADIIDIGCTPGLPFPALGEVVRDLVEAGRRVSVDTFDPPEIRTAVGAGAELVLSVNGSNIEVASDLAGTGRARRRGARIRRHPRHAGADPRGAGQARDPVSHRSDSRADRPRVHGVDRALR